MITPYKIIILVLVVPVLFNFFKRKLGLQQSTYKLKFSSNFSIIYDKNTFSKYVSYFFLATWIDR